MGKFCEFARCLVIKDPEWLGFHYLLFCGSPVVLHGFMQMRNKHMISVLSSTQPVRWSIRQKAKRFVSWSRLQNWKPGLSDYADWKLALGKCSWKECTNPKHPFVDAPKALHDYSVFTPSSCLSRWQKINLHTMSQELVQVCRSHIQTQKWCTGRVSKLVSRKLWEMSIPWTSRYVQFDGFFLFLTAAVWVQNFVAPSRLKTRIQKMAQCYGLAKNAGFFPSAMIGRGRNS